MRILLIGAGGQLGAELYASLHPSYELTCAGRRPGLLPDGVDLYPLDLGSAQTIRRAVRETSPQVIINAGAYTAVENAETERELAFRINAQAPAVLAEESLRANSLLVHFSTDYVFDGVRTTPYTERDTPHPLNVYGLSKLEGEQAILQSDCQSLVFRTSWLYSMRGNNFLTTIRRLAIERDELKIVDDQIGAPTWCGSIAKSIPKILERILALSDVKQRNLYTGLYHMTCGGSCSWYEFARTFTGYMREQETASVAEILPIAARDYASKVARPAYSVLDNSHLKQTFGISLPDWRSALHEAWYG